MHCDTENCLVATDFRVNTECVKVFSYITLHHLYLTLTVKENETLIDVCVQLAAS